VPITSPDVYPLARCLHAFIPERLRLWTGEPGDPDERDRLGQVARKTVILEHEVSS